MKHLLRTVLAAMAIAMPALPLAADWAIFNPCGGGPLCRGHLSLMVKGGTTPSGYAHTATTLWAETATSLLAASNLAKFSNQFQLPWNAGAEIGWNASRRIQFFLEYAHTQAKGKTYLFTFFNGLPAFTKFANYTTHSGYLGVRYYFEGWCLCHLGWIHPYIGFKTGFSAQNRVLSTLFVNGVFVSTYPHWESQTAVSGSLLIGLEWWLCRRLSAVLQGEFVGTQGVRPNQNVPLNPNLTGGITNLNFEGVGWLFAWPVTLGLRYTF